MTIKISSIHYKYLASQFFFFFFFIPITTTSNSNINSPIMKPQRLVMKLIHRNSFLHPYYNPNDTVADRANRDIRSSRERFAYLQAKIGSSAKKDFRANVCSSLNSHIFCANISIGNPPVPQLVVIDTGSNVMWVQCVPCKECFKQSIGMFDPSKSSTYTNLTCQSLLCNSRRSSCNPKNQCSYTIEYMDNSKVEGVLAYEQLTFVTSDDGYSVVPNVVLGCTHKSGALTDGRLSGAIGLGTDQISLASQLGGKFSYCIGSVTDQNYIYNQLVLGDGADFEGYATPFEMHKGAYYVTLEGISIGEKKLPLPSRIFKRTSNGDGGVVIDSGSTMTYLNKDGYDTLIAEVSNLMDRVLKRVIDKKIPWSLCYSGKVSESLEGFPVVTYHFAWGADLVCDAAGLFFQRQPDVFCMAVQPSNPYEGDIVGSDLSTIGVMAQQNYNVAYDLEGKKIYFQRIDCELLNEWM